MKTIELFEKAIQEETFELSERGINRTLFWAYRNSKRTDNDLIDVNEVIWDNEIEEIATNLKELDITEFTISSNFSGLIATIAAFDKLGFKVAGVTEVYAPYTDLRTNLYQRIPALRLERA